MKQKFVGLHRERLPSKALLLVFFKINFYRSAAGASRTGWPKS